MTYEELVSSLGPSVALSAEAVSKLRRFAALLSEWNEKMNLTAITKESEVVEKHFYDCLLPCKYLSLKGKKVADLGTGAGFPGLVWAIVNPEASFTLIEATGKKCSFLEAAVEACGLANVRIVHKRCEEMKEREAFDVVVARAVAPMGTLLEISLPLVKVGGVFLAMKGSGGQEEFNKTGKEIEKLGAVLKTMKSESLPNGMGIRRNFIFLKERPTPRKYPRPWATIIKKPLV
ncbi:MAG: 16S rRNA (guanine(527)-N(7))-methyltransferase RsmG [Bacilli bacterium]|jgi:16S rRNA (guanine527-N7)-methyltransferase|nr:16S rRNA (guanine(527)-N(7))-methyltransferase RsmG [Bacilli bacterium]